LLGVEAGVEAGFEAAVGIWRVALRGVVT
jgi:hypothetical protein